MRGRLFASSRPASAVSTTFRLERSCWHRRHGDRTAADESALCRGTIGRGLGLPDSGHGIAYWVTSWLVDYPIMTNSVVVKGRWSPMAPPPELLRPPWGRSAVCPRGVKHCFLQKYITRLPSPSVCSTPSSNNTSTSPQGIGTFPPLHEH